MSAVSSASYLGKIFTIIVHIRNVIGPLDGMCFDLIEGNALNNGSLLIRHNDILPRANKLFREK